MSRLDQINREMNQRIISKQLEYKKEKKLGTFEAASLIFGVGVFLAYNHPVFAGSWYAMYPGLLGIGDWAAVVPFVLGFLLLCFLPPKRISWLLLFIGQMIFGAVMLRGIILLNGIGWIVAYVVIMAWLAVGVYWYLKAYMEFKANRR